MTQTLWLFILRCCFGPEDLHDYVSFTHIPVYYYYYYWSNIRQTVNEDNLLYTTIHG